MFKFQGEFKEEDGFHVVEIHGKDDTFRQALVDAMKTRGYDSYGFSDLGESVQYNFVTAEFAEVLKERHHESCRNSLAGVFEVNLQERGIGSRIMGSQAEGIQPIRGGEYPVSTEKTKREYYISGPPGEPNPHQSKE